MFKWATFQEILLPSSGNINDYVAHIYSYNTSNFYGLPKIQKSKLIQNAIKEQQKEYVHIIDPLDLKPEPIVAGPICPTRPLSNLTDILLKPFLLHVKSYVKDNLDLLSKCSRENYEDTLLVTFGVSQFIY